jgi:hypothetical protein
MNNLYQYKVGKYYLLVILSLFIGKVYGQELNQSYSYEFYQKLNPVLYSTNFGGHTALKPYVLEDTMLSKSFEGFLNGTQLHSNQKADNKIFNGHLVSYSVSNASFYADILPDFDIGNDITGKRTTSLANLGLQFGGTLGNKFSYYINAYYNDQTSPEYLSTYIQQVGFVPSQGAARDNGNNNYQSTMITGVLSYTPSKYLNLSAGRDKVFIGDGYRSLLLSDYSSPYKFFRLTGSLGRLKYMAMWTFMNDPAKTSQYGIDRNKFGVFHYLDWSVNNRLSLGFFENLIGFFTDDNGVSRPFDFNYINPVIFLKSIDNAANDPDKALLGLTSKYKISNGVTIYGQFSLNEFHAADFFSSDGANTNKYGWQIGLRGTNLLAIKNLNFLLETNNVKPYTYSARSAIENYSNNSEPLAHPWGANFRELVGLFNYTYKKFDFSLEADFGRYGLDENGINYGKDIFLLYNNPKTKNGLGNYTTQGLITNLSFFESKIAYVINPKTNLRIELGGIYRVEKNTKFTDNTKLITLGIRSSFRQIYNDIASYKTH